MQELVELDIPAVLLALLILGAVIAVVRVGILRSRKSSKAREEEFRRLQRLAAEEQARAEADWEEEYRRLKQSEVSRKNELRRRTTEGEGGVYWKKQHTAEFDDEAAAAPQQTRRAADVGSRIQAAAELEAAVNRKKQQEAELEEAVSRKKQELEALTRKQAEFESANRKMRAEEEESARIKKQEELEAERRMQAENEAAKRREQAKEEEEAKKKLKEKADRESHLQQQQAELEAANQKEDPREEEAKPGNQAEEQANHTKSVPELQQQQGEFLRKPPAEPKKKHMVGGGGRYICAVCGKLTKRRCKQCKRVHYWYAILPKKKCWACQGIPYLVIHLLWVVIIILSACMPKCFVFFGRFSFIHDLFLILWRTQIQLLLF
jgi:myosin heavy subunit